MMIYTGQYSKYLMFALKKYYCTIKVFDCGRPLDIVEQYCYSLHPLRRLSMRIDKYKRILVMLKFL